MSKIANKIKYADGGNVNSTPKVKGVSSIAGIKLSPVESEHIGSLHPDARKAALHEMIGYTPKFSNPPINSPQWHQNNAEFNSKVNYANSNFNPGSSRVVQSADTMDNKAAIQDSINQQIQNQKLQNYADERQQVIPTGDPSALMYASGGTVNPMNKKGQGWKKGGIVGKMNCMSTGGTPADNRIPDNVGGNMSTMSDKPAMQGGKVSMDKTMGASLLGQAADQVQLDKNYDSAILNNSQYLQNNQTTYQKYNNVSSKAEDAGLASGNAYLMAAGAIQKGNRIYTQGITNATTNKYGEDKNQTATVIKQVFGNQDGIGNIITGTKNLNNKDLSTAEKIFGYTSIGAGLNQNKLAKLAHKRSDALIASQRQAAANTFFNNQQTERTQEQDNAVLSGANSATNTGSQYRTYSEGGAIKGPGTGKSDSIPAKLQPGAFIVPKENSAIAQQLRAKFFGETKKATVNNGNIPAKVSNGEHIFSPEEVAVLSSNGIDLNHLAPNSEHMNKLRHGGRVGLGNSVINRNQPISTQIILKAVFSKGNNPAQHNHKHQHFANGGPVTNRAKIEKLYSDPKIKAYLATLMQGEADPNNVLEGRTKVDANSDGIPDSSAKGKYQFTEGTKNDILKEYGIDAHKVDHTEQDLAALALIDKEGAVEDIRKGNINAANSKLKGRWPSIPEGTQKNALTNSFNERFKSNLAAIKPVENVKSGQGKYIKLSDGHYIDNSTGHVLRLEQDPRTNLIEKKVIGKATPVSGALKDGTSNWQYNGTTVNSRNAHNLNIDSEIKANNDSWKKVYDGKSLPRVNLPTTSALAKKIPNTAAVDSAVVPDKKSLDPTQQNDNFLRNNIATEGEISPIESRGIKQLNIDGGPQGLHSSEGIASAINSGSGMVDVPKRKVIDDQQSQSAIDKLGGPASVLALGQAGLGLVGLLKQGKRPQYVVGADAQQDLQQAKDEAQYGYSDAEKALAQRNIEDTRRADTAQILNLSNDSGVALANIRAAGVSANDANLQFAAQDAQLKRQKRMFKSGLVDAMEQRRRQQFDDKLTQFKENQATSADLLNAGISNVFGNLQAKNYANALAKTN